MIYLTITLKKNYVNYIVGGNAWNSKKSLPKGPVTLSYLWNWKLCQSLTLFQKKELNFGYPWLC